MKIFWDTNLFIYLWEEGPQTQRTRSFVDWVVDSGHEVVTSALTLGEILVHPFRMGDENRVRDYEEAFSGIDVVAFSSAVARHFAKLRAMHANLRPPDAMQLASAIHTQADVFVTHDHRLASITLEASLRIMALTDWETLKTINLRQ